MISVLLLWILIFATTVPVGSALCGRKTPLVFRSLAGLSAACVYAEYVSLFTGVSGPALAGFILIAAVCAVKADRLSGRDAEQGTVFSKNNQQDVSGKTSQFIRRAVPGCCLVLFMAYGASRGYIHTDTTLYHAQSIRWIEEFGLVPGLANLHNRLGYNSAAFPLTALYSLSFLGGQSFHAVSGYLVLLLMAESLRVLRILKLLPVIGGKRAVQGTGGTGSGSREAARPAPADFVRLFGIYYGLAVYDEMISPSSDYFMVCTALLLVIGFLELLDRDAGKTPEEILPGPYARLAMIAVWNTTVKLSAAPFVLLSLYPVWLYLRKKQAGKILFYAACAVLISLPFFIRNVLLTGYLLYPYPAIDLFSVPWKIDPGYALSDQHEILVWGRGYTDAARFAEPLSFWLPGWFAGQPAVYRLLLLFCIPALPGLLILAVLSFRHGGAGRGILYGTAAAGFLFWFRSAPLMRYGCVYVFLTAALFAAALYGLSEEKLRMAAVVFFSLFLLWKGVSFGREFVSLAVRTGPEYLLLQEDYDDPDCVSYQNGDFLFWHNDGAGTGYKAFPSSPFPVELTFFGDSLRDGFVLKKPEN